MIYSIWQSFFHYFVVDFSILFELVFVMGLDFFSLQRCAVTDLVWRWWIVCFFLYKMIYTTFIIFAIIFYGLGDSLLKDSQRLLSDFLFAEIITDLLFDQFSNVFISFGEIFVKFVNNHGSELFALLDGLGLFDCWM